MTVTPILGPSVATSDQARSFITGKGVWWWTALVQFYWDIAPLVGVRADVAFAQACKETGYGRFGRAVTPEHHNPCGLKIPDPTGLSDSDPSAHQRFPTWEVGVIAHLQHLALYAGAFGYPLPYTKIGPTRWTGATADPRHFSFLWNRAGDSVEGLSGNWAPASDYGESIVNNYLSPMGGVPT